MPPTYQYFLIPYESVPSDPTYTAWFATWSRDRPVIEPGMNPPLVVGVTTEATLPAGASLLGTGSKDPPPPPPPPSAGAFNPSEYQSTISAWMSLGRDEDE